MTRRLWGAVALSVLVAACGRAVPGSPGGTEEAPPADGTTVTSPPVKPSAVPPQAKPGTTPILEPTRYEMPPLQTAMQTYELQIPEATLQGFYDDVYAPEAPATFVYQGQSYPVTVRLRGASARTFPKKSWNVDFNDLRFEGREELNLVAEYQDQTLMVEKLAYDLAEAMGLLAPRTKYVRLLINGKEEGVFLDIEEVDKKLLKAHAFPNTDATIYRCGSWDCEMKTWRSAWQGQWMKITNKDDPDRADLDALLDVINFTPEPQFEEALSKVLDVPSFLKLMALEAVISNSYVEDSRSYYVSDPVSGKFTYVPWDLNNSDMRWWPTYGLDMTPIATHPLFSFTLQDAWLQHIYDTRSQQVSGYEPTFDNLRTRILANPALRARVLAETKKAATELLDPSVLNPRVEALHAWLAPYVANDPYMDPEKFEKGEWFVKEYVTRRFAWVQSELARLAQPAAGLVLRAFDPAGGWIEIENRGDAAVSTAGLVLTTYLRRGQGPANVPSRTLAPGETARFTAAELGVSFAPRGEVGLFKGQGVAAPLDLLYYGAVPSGMRYVRDAQSLEWTVQ